MFCPLNESQWGPKQCKKKKKVIFQNMFLCILEQCWGGVKYIFIYFGWNIHLTQIYSSNVTPNYVDNQYMKNYWNWTLPLAGQKQYFRRRLIFLNPFPMILYVVWWLHEWSFPTHQQIHFSISTGLESEFLQQPPLQSLTSNRYFLSQSHGETSHFWHVEAH